MAMEKEAVDRMRALRKKQMLELVGLSYSSVWRLERAGKFPGRIRLSAGRCAWRLGEVLDWLANREAV